MYKVLWFDDEHEQFQAIKDKAILEDVQMIGYTNSEEGGNELRRCFRDYDVVLLDGLFLKEKNQMGSDLKQTAFGEVAKIIAELKANGQIIPWFIYSGQPSFVKDKNDLVEIFKDHSFANGKVFDKSKDQDFSELLKEIKKAADANPVRQIKLTHPKIFSIFDSGLLLEETETELLEVFNELEKTTNIDTKAVLTKMRSIQEKVFLKLENINVIPMGLSFNQKNNHLSGNKSHRSNYASTSIEYQTDEIETLNKWIYMTCGKYIHELQEQHFGGYMMSDYALKSMFYGLLEILLWFDKTYKEYK